MCDSEINKVNVWTASLSRSQVFRTDFITAMKLHDSYQLNPEDYYVLSDPWRQEWEKGVQVPVSPESIPKPAVRYGEANQHVFIAQYNTIIRCLLNEL